MIERRCFALPGWAAGILRLCSITRRCTGILPISALALLISCTDPHSPQYENEHDSQSNRYIPGKATALAASLVTENRRTITWQDNSRYATGYVLERKLGSAGSYQVIGSAIANAVSLDDTTTILTDTVYYYRVRALSVRGATAASESLAVLLPFPVPSDVNMTCLSTTSIELAWSDSATFAAGYSIWQSVNGGEFAELARVPVSVRSFVRSGLSPAAHYRFRVQAYTAHNESRFSSSIAVSAVTEPVRLLYTATIQRTDQAVYSMAFSPDGKTLACGGEDFVDMFRTGDGKHLAQLPHIYNSPVWSVRFSPDGRVLASGHGGSVFLWDASTYSLIKRLYNYGTNEVFSVAFTPGGDTVVANADGGSLQLWDVSSWSLLGTYNGGNFSNLRIDISPDGKYIATGDRLRLLRVADGSVVRNLSSTEYSYSPVFSPSGNVIAFVEQDTLKLMNVADGTLLQGIREIDYCRDPVFDATGDRITAAGRQDGTVNVWQTATGALWLRIENGSISHSVAFSPLNNIIATGDWHGTVRVWGLSGAWAIDP